MSIEDQLSMEKTTCDVTATYISMVRRKKITVDSKINSTVYALLMLKINQDG